MNLKNLLLFFLFSIISNVVFASSLLPPTVQVDIIAIDSTGCDGDSIDLQTVVRDAVGSLTYTWSTNNGQLTTNSDSATTLVLGLSNSMVKITVTDGRTSGVDSIEIISHGIEVTLPNTVALECGQDSILVPIIVGDTSGIEYQWTGMLNNSTDSFYIVNNPGTAKVIVSNDGGCSDSYLSDVYLSDVTQMLDFSIRNVTSWCIDTFCYAVGDLIQLTNTSSEINGWSFEWDYIQGVSNLEKPMFNIYVSGNSIPITLQAVNDINQNCIISSTKLIDVLPSGSCWICSVGHNHNLNENSYLNNLIQISPNPSNGDFTIYFTDLANKEIIIQIFDVTGKQVYNKQLQLIGNDFERVDLSNIAKGVYLVNIQVGNDVLSRTITKY